MVTQHRKAIKLSFTLTCVVFSQILLATTSAPKNALEQYEAIAHVHKGCPENSQCDAEMGQLLESWKNSASRWAQFKGPTSVLNQELAQWISNTGWPTEFYAHEAISSTLAPILYTSSCSQHRKPQAQTVLLRAQAFVKGSDAGELIAVKGKTEYRLKLSDSLVAQTVIHHRPDKTQVRFYLPLGERPLYIDNDELVTLAESEDFYALLMIPKAGAWRAQALAGEPVSDYQDFQTDVACPTNAPSTLTGFQKTYCRTISDKNLKPNGVVQLFWDCP